MFACQEMSKSLSSSESAGRLLPVKCNVRVEEEVVAAFKKAVEVFGGVEVCINNAGLAHNAPLLSGNTEEWRDMLEVSVKETMMTPYLFPMIMTV